MSRTGSGTDAQLGADVDQSIVIVDDESEPALGTKRKRAGRKPSDAWDTFQKIPIPMLPPPRELTMASATFASMLLLERLRICASMQQHAVRVTLMPSWLLGYANQGWWW